MKIKNLIADIKNLKSFENILMSYPKTGSTIIRIRLCFLMGYIKDISHDSVNSVSYEIGKGDLQKNSFNLLKSHWVFPLFLFRPKNVITIIRDPFEVMCSHFEYYNRQNHKYSKKDINSFIKSWRGAFWYFIHLIFYRLFKNKIILINYANYVENPFDIHMFLKDKLYPNITGDKIQEIIQKTDRSKMNIIESKTSNKKILNFSKVKSYDQYRNKFNFVSKLYLRLLYFIFDSLKKDCLNS